MKFLKNHSFFVSYAVMAIIVNLISCLKVIRVGSTSNSKSKAAEDASVYFSSLFINTQRPTQLCTKPEGIHKPEHLPDKDIDLKLPRRKPNPFGKSQGFGHSAYLWDFVDDILKSDIMSNFNLMVIEARNLSPPDSKVFSEPYSLEKLLSYYSQGLDTGAGKSQDQLLAAIKTYNNNFDADTWKNSISCSQVYQVFELWGWNKLPVDDIVRKTVSFFDFNGDGRLSPFEFITFSIINNKSIQTGILQKILLQRTNYF
jgi:hypothetical protein